MKVKIDMVTLWTEKFVEMNYFYVEVLGFKISCSMDGYTELENGETRFAICDRKVMEGIETRITEKARGQRVELAFLCENVGELEETYRELKEKNVKIEKEVFDAPWNHRLFLISDPEGNVHEVFCRL